MKCGKCGGADHNRRTCNEGAKSKRPKPQRAIESNAKLEADVFKYAMRWAESTSERDIEENRRLCHLACARVRARREVLSQPLRPKRKPVACPRHGMDPRPECAQCAKDFGPEPTANDQVPVVVADGG